MYPHNGNNWSDYYNSNNRNSGMSNSNLNYSNQVRSNHNQPQDSVQVAARQYYQNTYYHQNQVRYSGDANTYQNQNLNDVNSHDVYNGQNLRIPRTQNFRNSEVHQNPEGQRHVYNGPNPNARAPDNGQNQLQNPEAQNFPNSQVHQNPEGQRHVYNGQNQNIRDSDNIDAHQNRVMDPNSVSLYPDSGFPRPHHNELTFNSDYLTYDDDGVRFSGVQNRVKYDSSDSESDSEEREISNRDSRVTQKRQRLPEPRKKDSEERETPNKDSQKIEKSQALLKVQESSKPQISDSGESDIDSDSEGHDVYSSNIQKSEGTSRLRKSDSGAPDVYTVSSSEDSDSEDDDVYSNKDQKPGGSRIQKQSDSGSGASSSDIPEYINTKQLGKDILAELKAQKIPQTLFAKKIIGRSQGTLSELLKKPKKWEDMKMCGQSTYLNMWQWLQQPLERRLEILKEERYDGRKRRNSSASTALAPKKARLIFSPTQKNTLDAIFKQEKKPSKKLMETISGYLKLDYSTVFNFFTNSRRRTRHAN